MSPVARRIACLSVVLAGVFGAACALSRVEKGLDAKGRDFVSKVRYIITPDERKAFLALAPEAREDFIADFWRRRDPSPKTEENEFKIEYFKRIDLANRLFSGGGAPGWLQDRGRVWITLGPPDNRETYPRGVSFYGVPTEIWWYGFFPITFVDERWVDDYRLDPSSAAQIGVLNQAQRQWNQPLESLPPGYALSARPAALADLEVRIERAGEGGTRITLVLPYKNIWMKSKGDRFEGALDVDIRIVDAAGAEAWALAKTYPLEVPIDRLKTILTESCTIEAEAPLKPGAYTLKAVVTNATDGSKASVERAFEI